MVQFGAKQRQRDRFANEIRVNVIDPQADGFNTSRSIRREEFQRLYPESPHPAKQHWVFKPGKPQLIPFKQALALKRKYDWMKLVTADGKMELDAYLLSLDVSREGGMTWPHLLQLASKIGISNPMQFKRDKLEALFLKRVSQGAQMPEEEKEEVEVA